jgi:hypothetical protein
MSCNCAQFQPIELDRRSITRRIKQSPAIRKRLIQIGEHTGLRLYLFRCPDCGQFWQSGHEWHFADREYLFHVPQIEIAEWHREPYRQPAAMMLYSAGMRNFFAHASFQTGEAQCQIGGCSERALLLSVFCRDHHIDSLQQGGRLQMKPPGRLFPPYYEAASNAA